MRAESRVVYKAGTIKEYRKAVLILVELSRRSNFSGVKIGPINEIMIVKNGLWIFGDVYNVWSLNREFELEIASQRLSLVRQ